MLKYLITLPLLFATVPVLAQDPAAGNAPTTVRVGYGDLNLASPAGRAELDRRIQIAVNQLCDSPDARDLRKAAYSRGCRTIVREQIATQREAAVAAAAQTASIAR